MILWIYKQLKDLHQLIYCTLNWTTTKLIFSLTTTSHTIGVNTHKFSLSEFTWMKWCKHFLHRRCATHIYFRWLNSNPMYYIMRRCIEIFYKRTTINCAFVGHCRLKKLVHGQITFMTFIALFYYFLKSTNTKVLL